MSERKRRRPSRKGQPPWLPSNYFVRDNAILYDTSKEDGPPQWVCSMFEPMALLRDHNGEGWAYLISYRDDDGTERQASIARARLHGNASAVRQELMNAGMTITLSGRDNPFDRLLIGIRGDLLNRGRIAHRPGWTENTFVTPGGEFIHGDDGETVYYPAAVGNQKKGTAEAQLTAVRLAFEVAREGENDLYAIAALAGAAGCVVDRAELDSTPIAALTGASSKGKTSAAIFGAAIFGNPESGKAGGGLQPLRGTVNAFELIAERRTGTALFLDEPAGASKRAFDLGELVFMLAGGSGKPRGKQGDALRRTPTWRTFAFLTAEFSVRQLGEQSRGNISAGYAVRAIDIDVSDAKRLPDDVFKRLIAVKHHYGHLGPMLANNLRAITPEDLRSRIEQRALDLAGEGASQMTIRAASVLAVLWVTGEVFEALGAAQEGDVQRLMQRTWDNYVRSEAAAGLSPADEAAEKLKHALFSRVNADVRPRDNNISTDERRTGEAVAYYDQTDDGMTFYVLTPNLVKLAGTSMKKKVLVDHLKSIGVLVPSGSRKNIAFNAVSSAISLPCYKLFYKNEEEIQALDRLERNLSERPAEGERSADEITNVVDAQGLFGGDQKPRPHQSRRDRKGAQMKG